MFSKSVLSLKDLEIFSTNSLYRLLKNSGIVNDENFYKKRYQLFFVEGGLSKTKKEYFLH